MFGSALAAKWSGIDLADVYAEWARSMQKYSLGAINCGMELCSREQYPPNFGDFVSKCDLYKPENNIHMIEKKFTPEQLEANKKRISEIVAMLAKNKKHDG
jgi:hypothetical protein